MNDPITGRQVGQDRQPPPDPRYGSTEHTTVEVLDVQLVDPVEERLRGALVAAGLTAGALAVVLLAAAFGFAVAARWADQPRPLDGTAVLCAAAALVAGFLGWGAVQYGIGRAAGSEPGEQVGGFLEETGVVDGPRLPPEGESGVSRSADGGR